METCKQGMHVFIAVNRKVPERLDYISVLFSKNGGKDFSFLGKLEASQSFFDPVFKLNSEFYFDEYPILTTLEKSCKRVQNFYFINGGFMVYSKPKVLNTTHDMLCISAYGTGYCVSDDMYNVWSFKIAKESREDKKTKGVGKKCSKDDCCNFI